MYSAMDFIAENIRERDAAAKRLETIVDDTPMDDHEPDIPNKEGSNETPVTAHPIPNHINISVNLDKKEKIEEQLKDFAHNRSTERVETLHAAIESYQIEFNIDLCAGNEGFSNYIKNFFSGILNTITGMLYLFKTALFDGWRDFKRSELTEYCQSHAVTVRRIVRAEEGSYTFKDMEHPEGMQGGYVSAIDSLVAVFNALNISATTKRMKEIAKQMYNATAGNATEFANVVETSNREFDKIEREVNRVFDKSSTIFTEKRNDVAKFKVLYGTNRNMEDIIDRLIKMDDVLQSVAGVESDLESIQDTVKETVDYLKTAPDAAISKKTIDVFSQLVRHWGFLFEKFSISVNDLYRVNHNVCVNLRVLADEL
jgi:hypothetical protein